MREMLVMPQEYGRRMQGRLTYAKLVVAASTVICAGMAIGWGMYGLFGHRLIAALYESESLAIAERVMSGRTITPLQSYYRAADSLMWAMTYWIIAGFVGFLGALALLRARLLGSVVLMVSSLALSSFLLFAVLECFPSLIPVFNLQNMVGYYGVKTSLVPDDTLIFRERPFSHAIMSFKGDQYSPRYMVEPPSFRMEWVTDGDGFRNNSAPGVVDVLAIGDSYVAFALDEADMFGQKLERLSGLRVANLGVGGYGPFQYLEVLKRFGVKRQPRYALFCFYEGNDVGDITAYLEWQAGGMPFYSGVFRGTWLQRYGMAVSEAAQSLSEAIKDVIYPTLHTISHDERYVHPDIVVINLRGTIHKALFRHKNYSQSTDEMLRSTAWQALKQILHDFNTICLENHITPIIVYIPMAAHIYAQYSTEESGANWLAIRDEQILAKANAVGAMITLCDELRLSLVDLSPSFEAAARQGKMLYYPMDTHWNSDGREVAAAAIAKVLTSTPLGTSTTLGLLE
jgi:SGNH hydrolase-like domain, acetyltransferase AlgX